MMKPTNTQQVESEKTKRISQQVESDAISPSLERLKLLEIIPAVIKCGDHVTDQDIDDNENQGHVMDNV